MDGEEVQYRRPHYDNLGQLMQSHARLFENEPACSYLGKTEEEEEEEEDEHYPKAVILPRAFAFTERPFVHRNQGLAECTLRVREDDGRVRAHLLRTFGQLFGIYGAQSRFEVCYSANAVLRGQLDNKWSLWYGLDYSNPQDPGRASINFLHADREEQDFVGYHVVNSIGDVENLRVDFDADQFAQLFYENHENSAVMVHSLVSIVFISK
jgi:hypothetical protein